MVKCSYFKVRTRLFHFPIIGHCKIVEGFFQGTNSKMLDYRTLIKHRLLLPDEDSGPSQEHGMIYLYTVHSFLITFFNANLRHIHRDLILVYKIFNGGLDLNIGLFPVPPCQVPPAPVQNLFFSVRVVRFPSSLTDPSVD